MKDLCIVQCETIDAGDLARVAQNVIEQNIPIISIQPDAVPILWTWLEKSPVKIIAKFIYDGDMPKLSEKINAVFKKGAHGARIIVADIAAFADELYNIREDLFFNRDLIVDVDIYSTNPDELSVLEKIRPDAICFDMSGVPKKFDDFVGRVYGLLSADLNYKMYFDVGNDMTRADQSQRLMEKIRPDLLKDLRFFIDA